MTEQITVVIPTIPPRVSKLRIAVESVLYQTYGAATISIPVDHAKQGAAINRQRGLDSVTTEWVAFLDDDDRFYPEHLEKLIECALKTEADYVYSWYDVKGGSDPRPEYFGMEFDPANPNQTTITTLVRTDLAKSVGFVWDDPHLDSPDRHYAGEDWFFTKGCNDLGAKIVHLPEKTWEWVHWGGNTSGLPRW